MGLVFVALIIKYNTVVIKKQTKVHAPYRQTVGMLVGLQYDWLHFDEHHSTILSPPDVDPISQAKTGNSSTWYISRLACKGGPELGPQSPADSGGVWIIEAAQSIQFDGPILGPDKHNQSNSFGANVVGHMSRRTSLYKTIQELIQDNNSRIRDSHKQCRHGSQWQTQQK